MSALMKSAVMKLTLALGDKDTRAATSDDDQFARAYQVLEAAEWIQKIADYNSLVCFTSSMTRLKLSRNSKSVSSTPGGISELINCNYASAISTAAKLPCPCILLQLLRYAEIFTPQSLRHESQNASLTTAFSSLIWIICTSTFEQLLVLMFSIYGSDKLGLDRDSAKNLFMNIFVDEIYDNREPNSGDKVSYHFASNIFL